MILALFAISLNLLVGYTGLVSFGHAAYFGIGAYTCAHPDEEARRALPARLPRRRRSPPRPSPLVFGFFCVRSTRIYFAMLTLAFAQIVWAICFKWNEVTGGEQGMPNVPYPDFGWMRGAARCSAAARTASTSTSCSCSCWSAVCLWLLRRIVGSPFGRMLTAIRENPERAEFIGVNVRRYQLAAFVLAAPSPGWPARCSASSTAACSPTSPTGRSRPRC